jgi:ABC-type spermidine/putrescine transport system permease subunit II
MYRAFFVVMIPVVLVALGYVVALRYLGFPPGYLRLFVAVTLFFGAIWWLGRRNARKAKSDARSDVG